ncbi:putative nucleic acid-binding protein [Rosellinia necatrix]|uniref:Putative nucleic acid-binding protein n=1 Tax=Rosellinia necatrix TaxID=77044 RepID=A0A1S7UMD2_ROSNE|nr:putative nucleic acid-binding protein [Rosellinia necatrix]
MRIGQANQKPTAVLSLTRYFSQTARLAEEGNEAGGFSDTPTQPSQSGAEPSTTIFVSNMTFDATDMHLHEAFSKYGEIKEINIGRDGRGLSRGFGFVTFLTNEAAARAVQEAHNSFWHGRRITVDFRKSGPSEPRSRPKMEPTNSLYIGNIPYESSDADLNQLFRSLDNVRDVRVAVDRNTGWPRGFAHADFHDVESAEKAAEVLRNTTLGGRNLRIDFAQGRPVKPSQSG